MAGYVVRISLPDRPGALGLVASRIGAVGGDIVAIHILERVDDNAIDEFVVELAGRAPRARSCATRSTRWTAPRCSTSRRYPLPRPRPLRRRRGDAVGAHVGAVHEMGHPLDVARRAARRG